jgi:uncharacterized protein YndB with AHSA1/START domain
MEHDKPVGENERKDPIEGSVTEQVAVHALGVSAGGIGGVVLGAFCGIAAGPVGSVAGAVAGAVLGIAAGAFTGGMAPPADDRTHAASRFIQASPVAVYEALMRPERLVKWLPPQGTLGRIDLFEPYLGGRFEITLEFPEAAGKSSSHSDIVQGRFVELIPGERVVQSVTFKSDDPRFAGAMTMTWSLSAVDTGTRVSVVAEQVPSGISREEHEMGMSSTLDNLARFLGDAGTIAEEFLET